MSESDSWAEFRPSILCLDPERHEDKFKEGIPDVSHVAGMVELKYIREWPKRIMTKVRMDHYTPEQRAWATRRARACIACGLRVNVHFLLHVGLTDQWLILRGDVAAASVGRATRSQLEALAMLHTRGVPTQTQALRVLAPEVVLNGLVV